MGARTTHDVAGIVDGSALRVAVLGAGFIGTVHARAARRAGARLVAVAASTPASTAAACAELGAEQVPSSAEELATSPDVDVVHVCTPNHLHHDLAALALDAGKHVVCEKPLATSLGDATDLHHLAADTGLVATVPFVYRFYPMVREARARLADAVGPVRLIHGAYLQDWLSDPGDDNWRVDAATSGPSRAFADIGSHWCDLVEFVTGDRIVEVTAQLVTAIPERRARGPHVRAFATGGALDGPAATRSVTTEDVALVMFRTAAGVAGTLTVSQISAGRKNQLRFEITGANGSAGFDQEHADTLWLGRRAGTEIRSSDPAVLHPDAARYTVVPPGHPHGYQDCFDGFVADTYRAIALGGTAHVDGLPTFADGARSAAVVDAVLRSSADSRWVTVDDAPAAVAFSKEATS